jgi:hypothetical protein
VAPSAESAHPLELATWRKELELIRGLVDHPDRVRIALVGATGAGKSSFLNAVLGQEVLPIGVMEPCTAFVTSVTYSADSLYHATTEFCSREEWQRDVDAFVSAMAPGDSDDGGGRGEERRVLEAARKRIEAVYGTQFDVESAAALRTRRLPAEADRLLRSGGRESCTFEDAKGMLTYLRDLVRGTSTLWPLVTQVSISGPYKYLSGGIELVDLPGLNDPNAARVEVTREFLRTSPFVWVVFSMIRGLTADIQEVLREEKLLRLLVLSGNLGTLSLIGTKADDVDMNIADQLGLDEDCSPEDLVRAYREQTVDHVRLQLEGMVRDLGSGPEDAETLERMVTIAREVEVHATSANAYMRLNNIGRLRRDFGIHEVEETGVPAVHRHLERIGKEAGAEFGAHAAELRLNRLREEITFFFRGKEQESTPQLEDARARIQKQHESFQTAIQSIQGDTSTRLKLYQERFLERIDPLLGTSVHGVRQAAEGWEVIHWSTLRALVHRGGVYRSPSTGRSYDLNEDLAEPLLTQLPAAWEHYFTDDLDRVTADFVVRLTEVGKSFCAQVRLVVEVIFDRPSKGVEDQLRWFQDKVALLASEATGRVRTTVRTRRNELAAKMPLVAAASMTPAYESSKPEAGPGMKRRILSNLQPTALRSAQPIYTTIQTDLVAGLSDLDAIIVGMFGRLAQAAEEQARIVAQNANLDVGVVARDPVVKQILNSMPAA